MKRRCNLSFPPSSRIIKSTLLVREVMYSSLAAFQQRQEEKTRVDTKLKDVQTRIGQLHQTLTVNQTQLMGNIQRIESVIKGIVAYTSNPSLTATFHSFLASLHPINSQKSVELSNSDWENVESAAKAVLDELSREVEQLRSHQNDLQAASMAAIKAQQELEVEEEVARKGIVNEIQQITRRLNEIDSQLRVLLVKSLFCSNMRSRRREIFLLVSMVRDN